MTPEEFREGVAELLDDLVGDEVRLAGGLWQWWRRVAKERESDGIVVQSAVVDRRGSGGDGGVLPRWGSRRGAAAGDVGDVQADADVR